MNTYKISNLGTINNFPDGDVNFLPFKDLVIEPDSTLSYSITGVNSIYLLLQIKNAFPELYHLDLTYLPGRADRKTDTCGFSLAAIAQIINLCNFDSVKLLQPHSKVSMDLIRNSFPQSKTIELIKTLLLVENIYKFTVIVPDKGAASWVPNVIETLPIVHNIAKPNILYLEKTRTETGIVPSIVQGQEEVLNNLEDNLVIVDDLVDGGGTFLQVAKLMKGMYPEKKIYLVVTHAIFSKGYNWFNGLIERIVCTDSYPHLGDGVQGITVIKV